MYEKSFFYILNRQNFRFCDIRRYFILNLFTCAHRLYFLIMGDNLYFVTLFQIKLYFIAQDALIPSLKLETGTDVFAVNFSGITKVL